MDLIPLHDITVNRPGPDDEYCRFMWDCISTASAANNHIAVVTRCRELRGYLCALSLLRKRQRDTCRNAIARIDYIEHKHATTTGLTYG